MNPKLVVMAFSFFLLLSLCYSAEFRCNSGCNLYLAWYFILQGTNPSFIADVENTSESLDAIHRFIRDQFPNNDGYHGFAISRSPFPCNCSSDGFVGYVLQYSVLSNDTYDIITEEYYSNLTTVFWLERFNSYTAADSNLITPSINVTVNCSCGDRVISKDYGLFITYPLRPEDNLVSIASRFNVTAEELQRYNVGANFSGGSSLLYIPGRASDIVLGGILNKLRRSRFQGLALFPGYMDIATKKSVEFSYEELAEATDNFSTAKEIGKGGFGSVYYAVLRGEVQLIGYCVNSLGSSLFLVYEYMENGNLSQHLHDSGKDPLPWCTRVQIALDSARGLEYLHHFTVPAYIHLDVKPANILIDKNYHGKVADFGLAKLKDLDRNALPSTRHLVGTFGYMPPEYGELGMVSPKADVYAFGVVLYELISGKGAIVETNSSVEFKGLYALFNDALNHPDTREICISTLVDPRLGDNYPFDVVLKMARLARACTRDDPESRPSMRSVLYSLMTLSSLTEDWQKKF
ncbi:chitin elicitor receptor kinase 1 isoform X2 [Hevea brasiliensis]|uniref:chitin elicitor receptor kinase 1 isoform X2 n=1 Tax=Hevea brasiliensis TaxID=3981 RepID=UPI0025FB4F8F|nr:chitin elicitor receptor kinase 1 isoform X2 [Hevea brasiliensis]